MLHYQTVKGMLDNCKTVEERYMIEDLLEDRVPKRKPRIHPVFYREDLEGYDIVVIVVRQTKMDNGGVRISKEYHKRETLEEGYKYAIEHGGKLYHRTLGKLFPATSWDSVSRTYHDRPKSEERATPKDSRKYGKGRGKGKVEEYQPPRKDNVCWFDYFNRDEITHSRINRVGLDDLK